MPTDRSWITALGVVLGALSLPAQGSTALPPLTGPRAELSLHSAILL